jgi:hypothetical protein
MITSRSIVVLIFIFVLLEPVSAVRAETDLQLHEHLMELLFYAAYPRPAVIILGPDAGELRGLKRGRNRIL